MNWQLPPTAGDADVPLPSPTEDEEEDREAEETSARQQYTDLISYCVGSVVGRWDIRFATDGKQKPELPDPFGPLPVCSPGMLKGDDGLPPTVSPAGYAVRIDSSSIFPDDPDHSDDIVRRVREVLELIWKDRAEAIEKEACEILGVKELRDYFRKPGKGGFWDDHVSRYSKSRRKAPIYWLLQSSKKNYALWLYYHRLDKDILFKALRRTTSSRRFAWRKAASTSCGRRRPPWEPPPRGPRSSTRTSTGRKRCSPNSGTSRRSWSEPPS